MSKGLLRIIDRSTAARECGQMKEVTKFLAVIFLAISFLLLCSCAGYELPPDQPYSNHPNKPGSGDVGYY